MTQTELVMDFLIKNSHREIARNEFFSLRNENGRIANVTARLTEARQRFRELGINLICIDKPYVKRQRRTVYFLSKNPLWKASSNSSKKQPTKSLGK